MDKKQAQLQETLGRLSRAQALALAKGVETQRGLGQEQLPTDAILRALRPHLQAAQATRVPTLCRLACANFEDFLTDRRDEPRPPGVIARAVIAPWWQGLQRVAAAEIAAIETELRQLVAVNDVGAMSALTARVAEEAQGWAQVLSAELRGGEGEGGRGERFSDAFLVAGV